MNNKRTKEEVLDRVASQHMISWDGRNFKRDFPKLLNAIELSMDEYAKEVGVNLLKRIRENNWQHYGKPNSTNPINIWYSENNYGLSDEQLYDKITKQPTQNNITL
jgi:hypothetical protein